MRAIDADALKRKAQKVATEAWKMKITGSVETILNQFIDWIDAAPTIEPQQRWIPCSERLPEEDGEYRITWVTSYAPSKQFLGDSGYQITSVWDDERKEFKGEWLLDEYIRHHPDVKVIAWKSPEEPYREGE